MNYKLIVLSEAREDILNCAFWITENQDPSGALAKHFVEAVEQTLERLLEGPEHFAFRHDDVRGIHVRRRDGRGRRQDLPYIVFYRFIDPEIVIVQVFPVRSDPRKVRK